MMRNKRGWIGTATIVLATGMGGGLSAGLPRVPGTISIEASASLRSVPDQPEALIGVP